MPEVTGGGGPPPSGTSATGYGSVVGVDVGRP